MKIIKAKDYDQMSRKAANIISAQVIMKPDCVLGLATGSSPIGTYRQLIDWYNKGDVDFSECYSVNLDEYVGLDITSDQSYVYFMRHNFFDAINIREDHTFIPNGKNTDVAAECERYDNQIASLGGIDLQLLGLGRNGHIGFNEPDQGKFGKKRSVSVNYWIYRTVCKIRKKRIWKYALSDNFISSKNEKR